MVHAIAYLVEGYLISAFSFKLDPGASYVIAKKNNSFYASGAQTCILGPGARVIRILEWGWATGPLWCQNVIQCYTH